MSEVKTEVVVIGSGPGGYAAAFRAADLGKKVLLVERFKTLGGVCLNVGCIPSKALLHVAEVLQQAKEASQFGISFTEPTVNIAALLEWKSKNVVGRLTGGLSMLAKQRQVEVVEGVAKFISEHAIEVESNQGKTHITFDNAIIAVGSRPVKLPFIPDDSRIMDSTDALNLEHTKGRMLVIGGGIIGLEMATVYHALGSQITIVELMDQLIPGADQDIVAPLYKFVAKEYENILLETKVTQVTVKNDGLLVTFEGKNAPKEAQLFDSILVAVGRRPNGDLIDAEKAGLKVDERGFIHTDKQMRTNVPHIFAIGDVVGNPMLAHKATSEGRIAAEVIAGKKHYFDAKCIASVAYTNPEVAWVGLTENEAKKQGVNYGKGIFPWAASGRALSLGRTEGLTKVIFDESTNRIVGAGIVGPHAGELITELALAIEMGCDAEDIALTIHPHPTLSETVMLAAEIFEGTITDLYLPKKDKKG
jgi:dihydrolipoamide dehydrogenase